MPCRGKSPESTLGNALSNAQANSVQPHQGDWLVHQELTKTVPEAIICQAQSSFANHRKIHPPGDPYPPWKIPFQ